MGFRGKTPDKPAAASAITATNPAAMDAITGAANAAATGAAAALTGAAMTYAGGGSASASPGDLADGTTYANDFAALEDNLASLFAELEKNRVDIAAQKVELDKVITDVGLVLAQGDKSTVDIAAAKTAIDLNNAAIDALIDDVGNLITAHGTNNSAVDSIIDLLNGES